MPCSLCSAQLPSRRAVILVTETKVSDGTRTHDRLDHNQELYQLSYAHRGLLNLALPRISIGQLGRLERGLDEPSPAGA